MSVSRVCQCLVGAVLWFAVAAPVGAATVTVAWDLNPEPDVNNYNVAVSTQNGVFTGAPVGNRTTWTFTGLQDNVTYYFAVQAQSPSGVSPFSSIGYLTPLTNPAGSEGSRSDFTGHGGMDLLWQQHNTGQIVFWQLNGPNVVDAQWFNPTWVDPAYKLSGSGDFNKDGKPDLIWHNQVTGQVLFWLMDGGLEYQAGYLPGPVDPAWRIASIRDFDGDGNPDIWWQNKTTGQMLVWYFNGTTFLRAGTPSPGIVSDTNWRLAGTADFNGDGKPDVLWQNTATGELRVWFLNGINAYAVANLNPGFVAANWTVAAVGDVNGDGSPDIVWRNDLTGEMVLWEMNGVNLVRGEYLSVPASDPVWRIMAPR